MTSLENLSKSSCLGALAALIGACFLPASLHAAVTLSPSGTADRTADINTAIGNARAAGDYVMLNAGTYYHDDEITISGAVEVRGAGSSTILVSRRPVPTTNPDRNGTVRLTGTGPKLRNIKVTSNYSGTIVANSPNRSQAALSCLVFVKDAVNFFLENVTASNGQGAGIMVFNSRGNSTSDKARILNCSVRDTLADGIHLTNGSKWVQVQGCNNTNTCDDMIAVVSYMSQPSICTDIVITGNTVSSNKWGRGIAVIGGSNVSITNNSISSPDASGIQIASEGGDYNSYQATGITASGNTISNANTGGRGNGNGITIQGRLDGSTILRADNITLTNNTVSNSNGRGVSVGAYSRGVTLTDMKINGTSAAGVDITSTSTTGSTFPTNITVTGSSTTASYIKNTGAQGVSAPRAGGTLTIRNTGFEQINKTGATSNDVIGVSNKTELTSVSITGNHYSNPSSNGVHNYIECLDPNYTPKPVTGDGSNTKASGITTGSVWAP